MKQIKLSRGHFALVDNKDYEHLSQFKWFSQRGGKTFYAARRLGSKGPMVLMHRYIMAAKKGQIIDHKNRKTLDNRRSNLRFCTKSQNAANSLTSHNKFGYKGVFQNKKNFSACIKINKKTIHLGTYKTIKEAAKAYDNKAKEIFNDFALLNFKSHA